MRLQASADYDFSIRWVEFEGRDCPVVMIEDLDRGSKSVTNDVENVIAEIQAQLYDQAADSGFVEPLRLGDMTVIYKDSAGRWDEIIVRDQCEFEKFGPLLDPRDPENDDPEARALYAVAWRARRLYEEGLSS